MRSRRRRRSGCRATTSSASASSTPKRLEQRCDFVVCEGTDFVGAAPALDFGRNADLANELGCPVLVVVKGGAPDETLAAVKAARSALEYKRCSIFGVFVNRVPPEAAAEVESRVAELGSEEPVYVLTECPGLAYPTAADV